MNTRQSARGNLNISGIRGRRSSSASRNNISIELQGAIPKSRSKVVHSPTGNKNNPLERSQSSNSLNLSTSAPKPTAEPQSSGSLPSSSLFQDIEIMDNQELSAQAQIFVPISGRVSATGTNSMPNPQYEQSANQNINVPVVPNNDNMNSNTPFDSLIALMEQTMRNTREEFRRELSSIKDIISQIGSVNQPTTSRPNFQQNFSSYNTPISNSNRSSNNQADSYQTSDSNVKLEKWKISFDGLGSVSDFLFKVETLSSRSKCSDEHLLSNFHVLLEGKAESWYWLFTKQNKNITYPLLRHAITKEFGHLESDHDILLKMSLRKQQYKESYDDFHCTIVSMNLRLQNPLPDVTLIDILKKNLNPNLRFLLFNAETRDINHFRDTARKAEKVIRDTKFQNPTGLSRNVSEIDVSSSESVDSDLSDPQVEAIAHLTRKPRFDYSNIQCWNCSLLGHSYIYCSQEIKKPFCSKCGNKGVLTPKCPNNHNQGNKQMGEMATGDTRPSHRTPSSN
ncbi:hypothetical protein CVS40_3303 [Lucilia cuprina]|nr:hypothetical protein CVS40_3303 [Lucilia cuprina]